MIRIRHLALLLLAAAPIRAHAAGVVQDTVAQETLVLLGERLAGPDPVRAVELIGDVATRTGRTGAEVRQHLRQRLDGIADLAETDTAAWRGLLDLRAPTMSQRQARRLLRELFAAGDRILADDADYLLGTSRRDAARRAHVPTDEAGTYLADLVAYGTVDTTSEWIPEPLGLVVSGWTEPYEFGLTPLYVFFDTEDEAYVREAVRDVQRFLVPRLVRRLPDSRGVRYAVRDRNVTALIDPDYEARVTVISLRFGGTNADLLPCMDATLDLRLPDTERVVWHTDLSYCTSDNGSASTHELDAFYDEVAAELYTRLDLYFETPK